MKRIRVACQSEIEAILDSAEGNATEEDRVRIHGVERACEQKIRKLFTAYYDEQQRDDFEDSLGSLRMWWSDEEDRIVVSGRYMELRGDPDTSAMEDLMCRGPRYVDRLAADGFLAEFRPEETSSGTALRVFDDDGIMVFDIHDNERCTINIASTEDVPWVTLDLADRLDCVDDGDLECRDGDQRVVVLVHHGDVDIYPGNELAVRGRVTFLVSHLSDSGSRSGGDAAFESSYEEAVLQKRVGAEVQIARNGQDLSVDSAPIGDLEVRVTGGLDGIDIYVESEQGEGKTLYLALDAALFRGALPGMEAYDVGRNGEETLIEVREAESLDDVLDPFDDGEAIEYWITEEDGASRILVSIPHFSEKRIHLSPDVLGAAGIPAPGVPWLFAGLAAVAVVLRRRV